MLVLRSFLNELRNVSDNLREDSTVDSVTTDSGKLFKLLRDLCYGVIICYHVTDIVVVLSSS